MRREIFLSQLAERLGRRRLVVVSNREPVVDRRRGDGIETLTPASGLTTALLPLVTACHGTWVAHGSGDADFERTDARDGVVIGAQPNGHRSFRLRRVRLERDMEQGYYYGYANEGLWPLCHVAYTAPVFRRADWEQYVAANQRFAEAVLDEIGDEEAVVVVHDFHLALVPRLLRNRRPDLLIAHFWHVPWPSREAMRVCPQLVDLLDGLLGNDLVGFHTRHHCNNFLETCDRGIEALVDWERSAAQRQGRRAYVRPFPISIDVDDFASLAAARPFAEVFPELAHRLEGRSMLLGVDRLDYTKGIPHRLRMLEVLLHKHPELVGKVTLVQVGAPTRTVLPRYRALADEVASLVADVNARFGTSDWRPIEYLPDHHDRRDVAVLMRQADACLVTSLHDGMNLVAKEYVAARAPRPGVLMLSKFTGAARELPEACLVNPYDIDGSADVLLESLRLPAARRSESMKHMM
ncbi:MAG: trehalose-6-phosphate synthase, partial [Polyangiales bacterium]